MKSPKRKVIDRARPGDAVLSCAVIEGLESRQLLSATGDAGTACPHHTFAPAATAGTVAGGFTPSQIRRAYGFDQVAANGSGQTIAIVDAYNHPHIAADLATFDARFGINAPPSLTIVGQTGGPVTSLRTNGAWASEVALDVEWAHAIAPGANLLLVETNTDTIPDLMAGVNYARNVPGVSAVSLAWGGAEFHGQLRFDPTLATPAGHAGVTFVAAAGDVGSSHGPNWPSSSPSVVSVGGTTLYIKTLNGDYSTEIGWHNTTGGNSHYERRPTWQVAALGGGARSTPDVAYNADPNTGFAVYSSVDDGGFIGWSSIAGTSAGVPQWAAQIAIADQLRAAQGLGSLDGAGSTLPALYKIYSPPQSAGAATYSATFNDITIGRSTSRIRAAAGYDQMTGLGSPKAPRVIAALAAAGVSTPGAVFLAPGTKEVARRARPSAEHGRPSEVYGGTSAGPASPDSPPPRYSPAPHARPSRSVSNARGTAEPLRTAELVAPAPIQQAEVHRFTLPDSSFARLSQPAASLTSSLIPGLSTTSHWVLSSLSDAAGPTMTTIVQPFAAADALLDVPSVAVTAGKVAVSSLLLDFDRPAALSSFADAMADFAYESVALGTAGKAGSHLRAWAVTIAVLSIDAAPDRLLARDAQIQSAGWEVLSIRIKSIFLFACIVVRPRKLCVP